MQDIFIVGDSGKGFPLVLVHGFLGSSRNVGALKLNFFKKNFRVVAPASARFWQK